MGQAAGTFGFAEDFEESDFVELDSDLAELESDFDVVSDLVSLPEDLDSPFEDDESELGFDPFDDFPSDRLSVR